MISVCQQGLISIIFLFWSLTARGDGVMGRNVDKSSVFASWHHSPFNRTKVHYLHYYLQTAQIHLSIFQPTLPLYAHEQDPEVFTLSCYFHLSLWMQCPSSLDV